MVAKLRSRPPAPPPGQADPIIHGSPIIERWLTHYWQKLQLPEQELVALAITQDRQEYMRWTGKRLNMLALGCYCYLPALTAPTAQTAPVSIRAKAHKHARLPGFTDAAHRRAPQHRHLIFIEPDIQPQSLEVTVAHELIHLADRVRGTPRRHRHHGYDSIAADEAAVTGYQVEELRKLLHEESARREHLRRERRPIRYLYQCPNCGKEYPRARRYSQAVSCSTCDSRYNAEFRLLLRG